MTHPQNRNRRDFLKLLALAPALYLAKAASHLHQWSAGSTGPGVIVIVLDALSASNLSLYGYPRRTSPNLERFASRSTVYHDHYSTANFTSPGTASILTGTYPWTHRAFHYEGQVPSMKVDANLFRYWGDMGIRLGFTQNAWADILLNQFSPWLDTHLDLRTFSLDRKPLFTSLFQNDPITSYIAVDSYVLELEPGLSASSLLALGRKIKLWKGKNIVDEEKSAEYPLGIPKTLNDVDVYFLLEELFDGMMELTRTLPPSALAYLHLFPPHYPFAPRAEYVDMFKGGWQPAAAPPAYFLTSVSEDVRADALEQRDLYDAYIATVDHEFGRLFDFMQQEGILDRNYVVLTSDHGEIYERGVFGHTNEYLYEPLIHVPLIISSPGQNSQVDIHSPTSSVDLVPTSSVPNRSSFASRLRGCSSPGFGGCRGSRAPHLRD